MHISIAKIFKNCNALRNAYATRFGHGMSDTSVVQTDEQAFGDKEAAKTFPSIGEVIIIYLISSFNFFLMLGGKVTVFV